MTEAYFIIDLNSYKYIGIWNNQVCYIGDFNKAGEFETKQKAIKFARENNMKYIQIIKSYSFS